MPFKIVSGNFINVKLEVNSCNDKESYYIYPGIEFRLMGCNTKVLNYKKTTYIVSAFGMTGVLSATQLFRPFSEKQNIPQKVVDKIESEFIQL